MNKLNKSNIAQICAILVSDLFAISVSNKIRKSQSLNTKNDWERFNDRAVEFCLTQVSVSLILPTTPKIREEWLKFVESEARKRAQNIVQTFLLGFT